MRRLPRLIRPTVSQRTGIAGFAGRGKRKRHPAFRRLFGNTLVRFRYASAQRLGTQRAFLVLLQPVKLPSKNLLSIDLGRVRSPAWATSMGAGVAERAAGGTAGRRCHGLRLFATPAYPKVICPVYVQIAWRMQGWRPRRPADRGRLVLAGGTRAVASRSGWPP